MYYDHAATTSMCPEAQAAFLKYASCGNPSSKHAPGRLAQQVLRDTTDMLKQDTGATEVTFTSGATEANRIIFDHVVRAWQKTGRTPHFVASSIEHKSILDLLQRMYLDGVANYSLVQPDSLGHVRGEDIVRALQKHTALVSVIAANNEIGTCNDIAHIVRVVAPIPVHTDATQAFGKLDLGMDSGLAALTMSGHKFGAGKGIGALLLGPQLPPMTRPGTPNVAAVAALQAAWLKFTHNRRSKNDIMAKRRMAIVRSLSQLQAYTKVLTPLRSSVPNILLLSIVPRQGTRKFCNGECQRLLDQNDIYIGIGSACNAHSKQASHVVKAINLTAEEQRGVLRISIGDDSNDIEQFIKRFIRIVNAYLESLQLPSAEPAFPMQ